MQKWQRWMSASLIILAPQLGLGKSKIDVTVGYFSLDADSSRGDTQISNLGSYSLFYRYELIPQFDFQLGYSLLASKTIGGDLSFGPDLGFLYFPFSGTGMNTATGENITLEQSEKLRPYAGLSFHQRQYQSTQATFAGFSIQGGVIQSLWERLSLRWDLRVIGLSGPSKATATELDVNFGISYQIP